MAMSTPKNRTGGFVTGDLNSDKGEVGGSSPPRPTIPFRGPARKHRQYFWAEGIFQRFEHPSLQIEVSQIIIHKTDQPNIVVNFFDADGLAGKDRTEVDFFVPHTDSPAI